jgi:hypothetical protein
MGRIEMERKRTQEKINKKSMIILKERGKTA